MQKTSFGSCLMVCFMLMFASLTVSAQKFSPSSYIAEHKGLAQQLMKETGVPASVILAVAIHESAYGNSKIAKDLNNHFGIKGKNSSRAIRSAYKGYQSALDSYHDFVGLLKRRKATQPLFEKHSQEDYKHWVRGIARSGYSTSGDWSSKVLSTINRYNLDDYDKEKVQVPYTSQKVKPKQDVLIKSINPKISGANFDSSSSYVVGVGDTLSTVALRYQRSVADLKNINKLSSTKLSIGQRLLF